MTEYIEDIELPLLGEWSSDAIFDPMHPDHGPLPDLFGRVDEDGGQAFTVALWDTKQAILVFLEMLWDEDPDPRTPMLPAKEVHEMRGWIAQSYRWIPDGDKMTCLGHSVAIPQYTTPSEEEAWRKEIYRTIMTASVRLAREEALSPAILRRLR